MVQAIKTIDAHVGGQPVRLVVDGAPRPSGTTLGRRSDWMRRHADHVRRAVVLEPRGHADMVAALFTEPLAPGAHAGLVFMSAHGYPSISGHGIIAAATIALERGLLFTGEDPHGEAALVLETVAGRVSVRAQVHRRGETRRVDSVAFTGPPVFVHLPGHLVSPGGRELRVDIAFGGQFCAIVDTEAIGIPLDPARLPDLRRLAVDIAAAANRTAIAHPARPELSGVAAVVFTGPPQDPEAHLRALTVSRYGAINRSPGGCATAAVMSVLDAMGLLPEGGSFVQEGIAGSLFRGRLIGRTQVGEVPAVSVEIEGTAWITGDHTWLLDDDDPFRDGFAM